MSRAERDLEKILGGQKPKFGAARALAVTAVPPAEVQALVRKGLKKKKNLNLPLLSPFSPLARPESPPRPSSPDFP